MTHDFDAYVTDIAFDRAGWAAALGDGTVRFEGGASVAAHEGAILCACLHPSGEGLLTGGDDGRVVWSKADGAVEVAQVRGRWIDAIDASAESGLIAFAAGKDLHVRDVKDANFSRIFTHERSVAALTFDPKGRRIAAATYNGAALWYARIADQKPAFLKWAGSHIGLAFSPDGKFLVSSMQENQLHGWRLSDAKDMRMGGYPAKVKSLAFLAKGAAMVTSGASGAVVWPFGGPNGPMGKEASEIGYDQAALVVKVAGAPTRPFIAAGLDDGRVWTADLTARGVTWLKAQKGAAISALALHGDRVAWGDEDGGVGVASLSDLG
jgi:WD40 repeat protein